MTDIQYDLASVRLYSSSNPYQRFRDLLPVTDTRLLPQEQDYTPLIHARHLGHELGVKHLYLKNETHLPTGTTKDRMAAVSLAYLYECGVRNFCTSSTGNSSTAYAKAISRFPDFRLGLFTAEAFVDRVLYADHAQVTHFGMRAASFVEAFRYAGEFASKNGFVSERGFFNPGRREGLKMAWLESMDQMDRPVDWYVQAVSSGMGVYGTWKGARELQALGVIDRLPALLSVQQHSCAPMAHAWAEHEKAIEERHIVQCPEGIAKAILRGDPSRTYPHMRSITLESGGQMVRVDEVAIREARRMVEELEGVAVCFAAATAVAGLRQCVRSGVVNSDATILVNLTGRDRSDAAISRHVHHWLVERQGGKWMPEVGNESSARLLF